MEYEQKLIDGITNALIGQGSIPASDGPVLHKAFIATDVDRFEEFLLDEDVVNKQALLKALQSYYLLPAIDVCGLLLNHTLVTKFPKEIMLQHGFVPYQQDGDLLQVIAARPQDENLPNIIGEYVSYDTVFLVGIYRDIADGIKEFYDEALTMVAEDEEADDEADFSTYSEEVVDDE